MIHEGKALWFCKGRIFHGLKSHLLIPRNVFVVFNEVYDAFTYADDGRYFLAVSHVVGL